MYTMTTLLNTKEGVQQFYKRFAPKSKGFLDLKTLDPEKKDYWFKLYQHDKEKKENVLAAHRTDPIELKLPRTKARHYIGIDPNRMSKVLNKLFHEKLNARWHNLVIALKTPMNMSKTVDIKKTNEATTLKEARAIGIIPIGTRILDNALQGVRSKIQD